LKVLLLRIFERVTIFKSVMDVQKCYGYSKMLQYFESVTDIRKYYGYSNKELNINIIISIKLQIFEYGVSIRDTNRNTNWNL
jgi:hypothetical protein